MHPMYAVPATLLLVFRAWQRQSLTPLGIIVAAATAVVHAIHPWSVFFALLVVFFLGGTAVTKVHKDTILLEVDGQVSLTIFAGQTRSQGAIDPLRNWLLWG